MNDDEYKLLGMIYNEGPPYNPPFDYITVSCSIEQFNLALKKYKLPFISVKNVSVVNFFYIDNLSKMER